MLNSEEIYRKVAGVMVESLNVEEGEIHPTSRLQGDLGAEAIDFLDILFRLEQEVGSKIPRGERVPEASVQGDAELVQDGRITATGLKEVRAKMPLADFTGFEKAPEIRNIGDLFTVQLIARYVASRLGKSEGNE